jgi:hypothetical protein
MTPGRPTGRWARWSFIADILFRSPALFASKNDVVGLGFGGFVPGHYHDLPAAQAGRILSGVQRVAQKFLVARHDGPLSGPNGQSYQWLQRALGVAHEANLPPPRNHPETAHRYYDDAETWRSQMTATIAKALFRPDPLTRTESESFKIIVVFCISALLGSVLLACHGIDLSFDLF